MSTLLAVILITYAALTVITTALYLAGVLLLAREYGSRLTVAGFLHTLDIGLRWPRTLPRLVRHWRQP